MTFPKSGGAEWAGSQASPWIPVNGSMRRLDAALSRWIVVDRDLTAPPGSCADGANYLIDATATGAWASHDGELATAVGANASNGWLFTTVEVEGYRLRLQDEDVEIEWDGAAWQDVTPTGTDLTLTVTTQAGTSYTADLDDANTYIQFTNGSPVSFEVPPEGTIAFPVGTRISVEQADAGTVTIDPGSGVTINSRGGVYDTAGQYAVATLIKVASDTWTLTGDLA